MADVDYEQFKVKGYDFWDLYLHMNQHPYVGRCYAWAKRIEADQVTDMNSGERDELFSKVIPQWDEAISAAFKHDRANVAFFGNTANHLHAHLIPRYNALRIIEGVTFEDDNEDAVYIIPQQTDASVSPGSAFKDPNPQGNYAPYVKKDLPLENILLIKKRIVNNLH